MTAARHTPLVCHTPPSRPGQIFKFVPRRRGPAARRRTAQRQLAGGNAQSRLDSSHRARRPSRTFPVGELFHSPGLPRQRLPGVPAHQTPEAWRASLDLSLPHAPRWPHPNCIRQRQIACTPKATHDALPCGSPQSPPRAAPDRMRRRRTAAYSKFGRAPLAGPRSGKTAFDQLRPPRCGEGGGRGAMAACVGPTTRLACPPLQPSHPHNTPKSPGDPPPSQAIARHLPPSSKSEIVVPTNFWISLSRSSSACRF